MASMTPELQAVVKKSQQLADLVGTQEDTFDFHHKLKNNLDLQAQLETSKRMEALLLDSENSLKEVTTEGNEDEVQQLQAQIDCLRLLIKDHNILLLEAARGKTIDDISNNMESFFQVQEVPKPQRRSTSFLDCFNRLWASCFTLGS